MKSLFGYFVLVALFSLTQCKKENAFRDSDGLNIVLHDKPVSIIQSYIQGKWRVHYAFGGICGSCKFDREAYDEYFEFRPNRVLYTFQHSVLIDTSFQWITYSQGNGDYIHNIIEYYGGMVPYHLEADRIANDTLVLARPFINNPDYDLIFLTKAK